LGEAIALTRDELTTAIAVVRHLGLAELTHRRRSTLWGKQSH